jgi:hypothetical protein
MRTLTFRGFLFGRFPIVYPYAWPCPADSRPAPDIRLPLVPEGLFAVYLVNALNLSGTQDEVEAENIPVVTNYFVDPRVHRAFRIDPVRRFRGVTYAGIGAPDEEISVHRNTLGSKDNF